MKTTSSAGMTPSYPSDSRRVMHNTTSPNNGVPTGVGKRMPQDQRTAGTKGDGKNVVSRSNSMSLQRVGSRALPGSPSSWPSSAGFCRSTTEISCNTDVEFDTVIFNWKIANFNPLRCMATDKGLPPEGDVLTSPVFLDNENCAWWLRLYPFEDREQHKGKVSLFLHTDRAKKSDIYFSFRFAALDGSSREVEDTGGGSALHKFSQSESIRNYGFYDFIRDEETLEKALHNDTLWVYCEVNIFTNPQTVVQDGTGGIGGATSSEGPPHVSPFGRPSSCTSSGFLPS